MDVPDATAQRRRSLRTRAQGPGRPLSRTRLFAKLIQTRPPFWEQYPLIPGSLYSTASCTPQLVGSGEDEWRLRGLQANTAVNEKRSPTATGCPGDEPAFRAKIAQSQESTLIKPAARRIPASWHRLRRPVLCVCVCVCVCVCLTPDMPCGGKPELLDCPIVQVVWCLVRCLSAGRRALGKGGGGKPGQRLPGSTSCVDYLGSLQL